jgi:hypothetical protein
MSTLRDMPTEQLFCLAGGFNHQWEAINKPVRQGQWGRRRNDICTRCGMERTTVRDINDRTAARMYDRPAWHVKVTEPYDSFDVSEEISRRLNSRAGSKTKAKPRSSKSKTSHLRAV